MGTQKSKSYKLVLAENYPLSDPDAPSIKLCIPAGTVIRTFQTLKEVKIPFKWNCSSHIKEVHKDKLMHPRKNWYYTVKDMEPEDVKIIERTVYVAAAENEVILTEPLAKANSPGRKKISIEEGALSLEID